MHSFNLPLRQTGISVLHFPLQHIIELSPESVLSWSQLTETVLQCVVSFADRCPPSTVKAGQPLEDKK